MAALKREGKVGDGLTFHGLRHTVGTLLVEAGYDLDTVRRWLGQNRWRWRSTTPRRLTPQIAWVRW